MTLIEYYHTSLSYCLSDAPYIHQTEGFIDFRLSEQPFSGNGLTSGHQKPDLALTTDLERKRMRLLCHRCFQEQSAASFCRNFVSPLMAFQSKG
ncbi:hypothetical protein Y1Q_0001349 [Alligator mississippiensis]|uniref:Uncharacterized protein n=1 Tax=Alligator mississippiensis TaxID=8496 RepID=A0A151M943_ALLMI|nr:hypothetical protein Y1Q_0001349 [Alligator mississippiensis]